MRSFGSKEHHHGLEKLCVARKPGIISQRLDFFKNKSNFLIFISIFTKFDKYMHKKGQISPETGLGTDFRCSPEKICLEKWSPCKEITQVMLLVI